MHRDLHRYLDGELPAEALPLELAREAREWDALLGDAALSREAAPPWLESRVMAALPPAHAPADALAPGQRILDWLLHPQPVRLRPATLLVGAAALVTAFALWPRSAPAPAPAPPVVAAAPAQPVHPPAPAGASTVYVQFTLTAPGARSVEVAGDFNGWQPARAELQDPEGDGVWSGLVALPAGVHKYMFVIDGRRWVSDPHAHHFVDDGFGMKNSLIAIAPPARSS